MRILKTIFIFCIGLNRAIPGRCEDAPAPPPPSEAPQIALGGQLYDAEEVKKAYENARKKFAYHVGSREAVPAGKLKARYFEGMIVQRTGARYMLQTGDEYRIIFIRNGHTPPVDQKVGFMLVERNATMKNRIPGGDVVSMKQYDDVTILPADFVRSFNRGVPIAGKNFAPAPRVLGEKEKPDRLESQMERRTIKVNRK